MVPRAAARAACQDGTRRVSGIGHDQGDHCEYKSAVHYSLIGLVTSLFLGAQATKAALPSSMLQVDGAPTWRGDGLARRGHGKSLVHHGILR